MVKSSKKPPPDDPEKRIALRLEKEVRKALEALAKADGRDLSGYVRRILTEHVRNTPVSRKR